MYNVKKIFLAAAVTSTIVLTSCMGVEKIEKKQEISSEKTGQRKVSEMNFERKSIREVRNNAEEIMGVLGTDKSEFQNIGETHVAPIITDKDEIYSIQLTKLEGNDLTSGTSFDSVLASKKIISSCDIYRNDQERIKKKLNMPNGTDIKDLIAFAENYMDTTYQDSEFQWVVEYVTVHTSNDQKDYAFVSVRPSYDGVVFTGRLVLNDGVPTNIPIDFRRGTLCMTEMNKIYEYQGISPYYKVEKQGEAISEILDMESVLSIVANKIDKNSVSEIKMFELAYRLKRDLSAVPIWNIVVLENGHERNFQIDAVTGDVYFE